MRLVAEDGHCKAEIAFCFLRKVRVLRPVRLVEEDGHCKGLKDGVEECPCELCLEVRLNRGLAARAEAALEADAVCGRVVVEAFGDHRACFVDHATSTEDHEDVDHHRDRTDARTSLGGVAEHGEGAEQAEDGESVVDKVRGDPGWRENKTRQKDDSACISA